MLTKVILKKVKNGKTKQNDNNKNKNKNKNKEEGYSN